MIKYKLDNSSNSSLIIIIVLVLIFLIIISIIIIYIVKRFYKTVSTKKFIETIEPIMDKNLWKLI